MAVLFFFLFCVISCPSVPRVVCTLPSLCPPNSSDAAALLAFKEAIISDPFHILSTWKLPQTSNCSSVIPAPCEWEGVACESHRVVALQLYGLQLIGPVSPSLAQLPFLRALNLSSNNFSGGIPVELDQLRLSLISLDLSMNQLSGSIPPELGMLNKLKSLVLWRNELTGEVPASLANCTALRDLDLSSNELSGSIPPELGMLNKLETLYMWGNELTGEVPASLANCTAFRDLELSSNNLWGSIPPELGMLNKLETLYLWGNELTGEVPASLANCTALRDLDLSSNNLWGSIPPELGMLNRVEILLLWGNELTGGVPASLGNYTALMELALYSNKLSGRIPTELGMLNRVEDLYLWGNELTGGVPASLGNCTALRGLGLDYNKLSGRIPTELGMLNRVDYLSLSANELTGGVPASLENCTALTHLLLDSNQLSGSIPPELGMLNKAEYLSLWRNELTGGVPASLANCTALKDLELSINKLSGNIPDVFFETLSSLGYLALSANNFSGPLPRSLTRLELLSSVFLRQNAFNGTIPEFSTPLLNYLDIATNNLSGSIPESLGTAKGLVGIDLSYNLLSGQVPPSLGSLQQLTFLNLSNNQLSGSIPSALGSCPELQILNLSHNKLTGKLPSSFESLGSLINLDLSYNQLEGLVPNMKPFNDTKVADLRENPLLCGPIVDRTCNASDQGSFQRETFVNMKWIVPLAIAVVLAGLMIFGIVIWRLRNLVGCATNIPDSFRRVGDALERKYLKVSADELREATDGFSEVNILGAGGVSIVYRAVLADTVVAVKVLKAEVVTRVSTDVEVARLKREVELLGMVRHRNIVRVLGCCFNLDMQAIILELMPNGNLDTYLHGMQRQEALTKVEKLRLLRGIAHGLEYLHHWHDPGQTIVHCDVKPANILLDEEWEPRIADFGIAKLLEQSDGVLQQSASILLRGSVGYIPPEYAFCTQVSSVGDVYSFGVVMLEILTGKSPTEVGNGSDGEQQQTLMLLVQAAYPHELLGLFETPGMTQDEAITLAQLALSCTSAAPTRRPTMLQVGRSLDAISNLSIDTSPNPTLLELLE